MDYVPADVVAKCAPDENIGGKVLARNDACGGNAGRERVDHGLGCPTVVFRCNNVGEGPNQYGMI